MQNSPKNDCLFEKVRTDVSAFSSIKGILSKIKDDEGFAALSEIFDHLFTAETVFTITSTIKRTKTAENRIHQVKFNFAVKSQHCHLQRKPQTNNQLYNR